METYRGHIADVAGTDADGVGLAPDISYTVVYNGSNGARRIPNLVPYRGHLILETDDGTPFGIRALPINTPVTVYQLPSGRVEWRPDVPETHDVHPCEEQA